MSLVTGRHLSRGVTRVSRHVTYWQEETKKVNHALKNIIVLLESSLRSSSSGRSYFLCCESIWECSHGPGIARAGLGRKIFIKLRMSCNNLSVLVCRPGPGSHHGLCNIVTCDTETPAPGRGGPSSGVTTSLHIHSFSDKLFKRHKYFGKFEPLIC